MLFSIVKLKFRIENKKEKFCFFVLVSPIISKASNFRVHNALRKIRQKLPSLENLAPNGCLKSHMSDH